MMPKPSSARSRVFISPRPLPVAPLLALLATTTAACAHHGLRSTGPSVTATGEGKASGKPNLATVTVAVVVEAKTATSATSEAALRQSAVIAAVKGELAGQGQVQTSGYSLSPVYDYNEGRQTLRGYQVRNALTAELRDPSKVGAVIDAAVQAGATEIASVSFGLEDSGAARAEAIRKATEAAMREATAAARAAGRSLGTVKTIAVGSSSGAPPPMPLVKMARMDMQASTPVEPGAVEITATVTVEATLERP
ncbi:MAG: SIMPL domain-containing protein [Myxococcales bacterium]|nr:SIMPL domain-containing protein [Myxococcales bacterium]